MYEIGEKKTNRIALIYNKEGMMIDLREDDGNYGQWCREYNTDKLTINIVEQVEEVVGRIVVENN